MFWIISLDQSVTKWLLLFVIVTICMLQMIPRADWADRWMCVRWLSSKQNRETTSSSEQVQVKSTEAPCPTSQTIHHWIRFVCLDLFLCVFELVTFCCCFSWWLTWDWSRPSSRTPARPSTTRICCSPLRWTGLWNCMSH